MWRAFPLVLQVVVAMRAALDILKGDRNGGSLFKGCKRHRTRSRPPDNVGLLLVLWRVEVNVVQLRMGDFVNSGL